MCSKTMTILLSPASERSRSIWLVITREITNTFSLKTHSLSLVWLKTKSTHIVVSWVHQKLSINIIVNLSLDSLKTCLYSFEDEAVATAHLRCWQNHFRACESVFGEWHACSLLENSKGIWKRVLPISRTASQYLCQNFAGANDPAGYAG